MSASLLLRASVLMRKRADAAMEVWKAEHWTPRHAEEPYSRGMHTLDLDRHAVCTDDGHGSIMLTSPWDETQVVDHATSWGPAVAYATADALEGAATLLTDAQDGPYAIVAGALTEQLVALARTYLREDQ